MSKLTKNEDAFTGLEAAIVLIAFVVVAAVFSYVVLGAGFFTTQKSQEVVHTGVAQTSSSVEIVGDVIGKASTTVDELRSVLITVGLSTGGGTVDFNKVVITYSDADHVETLTRTLKVTDTKVEASDAARGEWHIYEQKNDDKDVLLEPLEQYTLTIGIPTGVTVGPNHPFTVEIKPSVGAPYAVTRTTPPQFTAVNILR